MVRSWSVINVAGLFFLCVIVLWKGQHAIGVSTTERSAAPSRRKASAKVAAASDEDVSWAVLFWSSSWPAPLGGDPGVDAEFTGGIIYFLEPGNLLVI